MGKIIDHTVSMVSRAQKIHVYTPVSPVIQDMVAQCWFNFSVNAVLALPHMGIWDLVPILSHRFS